MGISLPLKQPSLSIQPGGHQSRKEHEAAVWLRDVEESPCPLIDCFIILGCGQVPYVDRERPAEPDFRQKPFPCQGCSCCEASYVHVE
ncbi:hypothetical protein V5799_025620 [Amblyomma americanum]|uniref:Uncharacterized protein n=1 Tax=Amblyomma americanum TaxID=6943 RepID=A0AAQ4E8R1_AMBAM